MGDIRCRWGDLRSRSRIDADLGADLFPHADACGRDVHARLPGSDCCDSGVVDHPRAVWVDTIRLAIAQTRPFPAPAFGGSARRPNDPKQTGTFEMTPKLSCRASELKRLAARYQYVRNARRKMSTRPGVSVRLRRIACGGSDIPLAGTMERLVAHSWTMPMITSFILVACCCGCTTRPPAQIDEPSQERLPDVAASSVGKAPSDVATFLNDSVEMPPEIPPPRNESEAQSRFTEATGLTWPSSAKVEAFGGHHWPPALYVVLRADREVLSEWERNGPPWHHESWQCGPVTSDALGERPRTEYLRNVATAPTARTLFPRNAVRSADLVRSLPERPLPPRRQA